MSFHDQAKQMNLNCRKAFVLLVCLLEADAPPFPYVGQRGPLKHTGLKKNGPQPRLLFFLSFVFLCPLISLLFPYPFQFFVQHIVLQPKSFLFIFCIMYHIYSYLFHSLSAFLSPPLFHDTTDQQE